MQKGVGIEKKRLCDLLSSPNSETVTIIANVAITPTNAITIFFRHKHLEPNVFGLTFANCFGTTLSLALQGVSDCFETLSSVDSVSKAEFFFD